MDMLANAQIGQKPQSLKRLAFAVWLLLVGVVLAAILHQDRFFTVNIQPIAHLEKKIGGAVARSEGVVRWREVMLKEGIFDGDMIATGEDGRVRIKLGRGQMLTLAENTQVKITAISSEGKDFSFMIKLIRGTASGEVANDCMNCGPIIIRAGDETFRVSAGKQVGIVKDAGTRPVRKFQPSSHSDWTNTPVVKTESMALAATFVQPAAAALPPPAPEPVKVAPKVAPAPPPAPVAVPAAPMVTQAMEATVEAPPSGAEYWTMESRESLKSKGIAYPIGMPAEKPAKGEWRPRFEIVDSEAQHPVEVPRSGITDTSVYVGLDKALSAATVITHGVIKEYIFGIRGGAEVIYGKERGQSMSANKVATKVYSLGDAPVGPVSIGLDSLTAAEVNPATHWLRPKQLIEVKSAPIGIHLASSEDYSKFLPFIRGSSRIGISHEGFHSADGLFVVRKQAVVAQLTGSKTDKPTMDKVMNALGADFIFKGPRSALHDVRGTSQAALADSIGALLDKGKVLYLMKRNKIYPVSRDFIKTSSEVAAFVDTQAMAIFLQSVEIVDYH